MATTPRYRKAISRNVMDVLRELPKERILAFLEQHYMLKKRGPKPRAMQHLFLPGEWEAWKNEIR